MLIALRERLGANAFPSRCGIYKSDTQGDGLCLFPVPIFSCEFSSRFYLKNPFNSVFILSS